MNHSKPLHPRMDDAALSAISNLGLAHMGDAVYEMLVRTWLCTHGRVTSKGLHRETVGYVAAPAQAKAVEKILPLLTEEEAAVYKRGRNAKAVTRAKNATMSEYRRATGFEALMGYLYLKGDIARMLELIHLGVEKAEVTL